MIGRSTSWRKLCESHAIPVYVSPDRNAANACGNDTSEIRTNTYAAHMLPTCCVMNRARRLLKWPTAPAPWTCIRISCFVTWRGTYSAGEVLAVAMAARCISLIAWCWPVSAISQITYLGWNTPQRTAHDLACYDGETRRGSLAVSVSGAATGRGRGCTAGG